MITFKHACLCCLQVLYKPSQKYFSIEINMSFKIVKGHAANGIDKLAKNKFRSEWLDGVYCVNSEKVKYGDSIVKINEDGKCYCTL